MFKSLITLAALFALAAPAMARQSDDPVTVVVKVSDLDLHSPAGAQAAMRRITSAAAGICGGEPDRIDMGRYKMYRACVADVTRTAIARIDAPQLAGLAPPARTGVNLAIGR